MIFTDFLKLDKLTLANEQYDNVLWNPYGLGCYGIHIDKTEDLTVVDTVKEMGIIVTLDSDEQVSESVLDVAITYKLAKVKILLEIPFSLVKGKSETFNYDYFVSFANNLDVSLSFLPPKFDANNKENSLLEFQEYKYAINKLALSYFKMTNFSQNLMPLTNYIEYLFVHILDSEKPFVVKDPYVLKYFANELSQEQIDELKEELKLTIYNAFDGQSNFEETAKALMKAVYDTTKDISVNYKEQLEKQRESRKSFV